MLYDIMTVIIITLSIMPPAMCSTMPSNSY